MFVCLCQGVSEKHVRRAIALLHAKQHQQPGVDLSGDPVADGHAGGRHALDYRTHGTGRRLTKDAPSGAE